ncbi:MAG: universal stress protein [Pseudomonadales bacterium]|nr:universal stress protein [Pseudomonadales bacterium]
MSLRILVAVDGSEYSLRAVAHVLRLREAGCDIESHLLNVQMPLESGHVRQFIARESIEEYYRDEGLAQLKGASAALEAVGQPCTTHVAVGHIAQTVTRYAAEMNFDLIVIGTHGRTGLRHAVMGSVATEVIKLATVPVTIVKNA